MRFHHHSKTLKSKGRRGRIIERGGKKREEKNKKKETTRIIPCLG
jgi:hypothetical protein